jgi:hypothetical protein
MLKSKLSTDEVGDRCSIVDEISTLGSLRILPYGVSFSPDWIVKLGCLGKGVLRSMYHERSSKNNGRLGMYTRVVMMAEDMIFSLPQLMSRT